MPPSEVYNRPLIVGKNFEFRGDLAETTLPEMLYAIYRFQVPGIIEASREGVVKRIFIKEGNVLHATSTDLDDSLGSFLLREDRISRSQYEATMEERQSSDQRYGALLVERGAMSPEQVYEGIREHVEAIVWSLFYWQDGQVSFQIGDFKATGMVRILLPMRQVILNGIKQAPNAKALVGRLGRRETLLEPCYSTEDLVEVALDAKEYAVLRLVDGSSTLYDVCTGGPLAAADNAKLLYAFYVLGLIKRAGEADTGDRKSKRDKITIRFKTEGDLKGQP